jgi:hypothetical protein
VFESVYVFKAATSVSISFWFYYTKKFYDFRRLISDVWEATVFLVAVKSVLIVFVRTFKSLMSVVN